MAKSKKTIMKPLKQVNGMIDKEDGCELKNYYNTIIKLL
jgi:hypothetical protein